MTFLGTLFWRTTLLEDYRSGETISFGFTLLMEVYIKDLFGRFFWSAKCVSNNAFK